MTPHEILKKYWGYDSFRGIQEHIISQIMAGNDVLGLMPTGGGKSITFQVPALALEGVCIVVSPLIALMKDQVQNLKARHVKAAAIYSGMSHNQILETLENAVYGGVKILYVSPERLESELFQAKLSHMKVSFFTIDESHCICQWGYDFRPSYLKIAEIRRIHPKAPVLALTATATPAVVKDIQDKLGFKQENCLSMSFLRPNLSYIVKRTNDKQQDILDILNERPGSAIIYVSSRRKTLEIADFLRKFGITAEGYNAGLTSLHRDIRQQQWTDDRTRVIVATNAFGMGIDKPDVRTVIHVDVPNSLEAYFQEAGRAGRDGEPAEAILLVAKKDFSYMQKTFAVQYPEEDFIKRVYEYVSYFYEVGVGCGKGYSKIFPLEKFCKVYKFFPTYVNSALHILTNAGYIKYDDERDSQARIRFIVNRDELYQIGDIPLRLNELMQVLLRKYTGLFTSYVTIEEEYLADMLGMDVQEVYQSLLELSRYGIIRYIPRSKEPMLTFLVDRVAPEDFFLPKESYKILKARFKERLDAIVGYVKSDDKCRTKLLLAYFGEKLKDDCGQCDVCRRRADEASIAATFDPHAGNNIRNHILSVLSDGKQHHISELSSTDFASSSDIMAELRRLLHEEIVKAKGVLVSLGA